MKARFAGWCPLCQSETRKGDDIGRLPSGPWGHKECADFAANRVRVQSGATFAGRAPAGKWLSWKGHE